MTKRESKADIILHPVRLRILRNLVGGRPLSAQEIGEFLPDVPIASLYRHLKKMATMGVITVAEERPVRGTVERFFTISGDGGQPPSDLSGMSTDDHMRYFLTFISILVGDFERYLLGGPVDLLEDGAGYRQVALQLSSDELAQLTRSLASTLSPYLSNEPGPGRRRRILTTILIPDPQAPSHGLSK